MDKIVNYVLMDVFSYSGLPFQLEAYKKGFVKVVVESEQLYKFERTMEMEVHLDNPPDDVFIFKELTERDSMLEYAVFGKKVFYIEPLKKLSPTGKWVGGTAVARNRYGLSQMPEYYTIRDEWKE